EVALGIARGVAVGVGPLCAMGVHAAMSSTANRGARNKRIAPEFPRRSASRTRLGTMRRPRRDGRRSKRNAAKASWATFENLAQRLGRVRVAALRRVVVRFRVAFRFAAELDRVARASRAFTSKCVTGYATPPSPDRVLCGTGYTLCRMESPRVSALDTARSFIDAVMTKDAEAAVALCADDVEVRLPGVPVAFSGR